MQQNASYGLNIFVLSHYNLKKIFGLFLYFEVFDEVEINYLDQRKKHQSYNFCSKKY